MTHICISKLIIIGSDNGLSPDRHQAIIWTNAGILLIGPLATNFSEILIEILTFSLEKMRSNVSSAKWRPFCLGLNVLMQVGQCHEHISAVPPLLPLNKQITHKIAWSVINRAVSQPLSVSGSQADSKWRGSQIKIQGLFVPRQGAGGAITGKILEIMHLKVWNGYLCK